MNGEDFRRDERGVSSTVSYILAIGITIVLVAGLTFSFGGVFDGNVDRTTDSELQTIAEGLATELIKVDSVVDRSGGDGTHATMLKAPRQIAGQSYTIAVGEGPCTDGLVDAVCVTVETADRSHSVPIDLDTEADDEIGGGDFWIVVVDGHIELRGDRPT